jgi:hypothetical protein
VWRDSALVFSIPITVLVLLLVFAFWITLPLAVIGLFCGCRYRLAGKDIKSESINDTMDGVAKAADAFKEELRASMDAEDEMK